MAFHEDRSDLISLRRLLSQLVSDVSPSDWLSGVVLVTTGSGPFPELEFDQLLSTLGGTPSGVDCDALVEAEASGDFLILIVLGRRDFKPEAISELIQEAGGFALRFVSQEDLISILLLSSGEEVLRVEDIEIDASELVARHPAFAWLEDRFGWSTWADDLVPEWNEFVEDPSADHSAVVASGQGETGNDAGEEVESDDENNGGDEDEMEDYVEYDEQLEDEAVDDEDAAEASSIGDPDHAEQSAVWANRSQSEQDRFIADLRQFGMLKAFGYTVGAKASSDATRRARLRRALVEELPTRLGRSYIEECGPPNSLARLKKMADSIATFTRNAKRRRSTSMEESIRHWEMDLAWMKQEWYRPGMGFDWPGTYAG